MGKIEIRDQVFLNTTSFLRQLVKEGLQHVVISPGSRSTPLTLAVSILSQLKKHVVLDERCAAFLALGIAKATNNPAALICTSGTAAANYLPAVIEASKSGVSMLLLTADRPARLHGTGANQTINQKNILGDFTVLFESMGEPFEKYTKQHLKDTATHYFHNAVSQQGPVHINFPFDKPLEPSYNFLKAVIDENKSLPASAIEVAIPEDYIFDKKWLKITGSSHRPLFIVGQLTPAAKMEYIFALAERLSVPVLTEQGITNDRLAIQGFEGFLRSELNQNKLEPDTIFRFGSQPASKSLLKAVKNWSPKNHIYFQEGKYRSDIENSVTDFIEWNNRPFKCEKLDKKDKEWLQQWKAAEKAFENAKNKAVVSTHNLTDGHIYHHLSPQIPEDWFIFIANSFPVRDQSLFARWKTQKLFTNRGASGIDGITSTAMGVNIGLNQPGVLFTGDLSFLHDTNALLNKKALNHPLIVVVINNRGGSLFRMLPIADFKEQFTPYFETPQQADIATLACSYQIDSTVINSVDELKKIDLKQLAKHAASKIQIIECKTDPDASINLRKKLWGFNLV